MCFPVREEGRLHMCFPVREEGKLHMCFPVRKVSYTCASL